MKLLRRYAREQSIRVIGEYVEAESAKKAGRERFAEMLEEIRKLQQVDGIASGVFAILTEKTDRLYRNFKDYVMLDELEIEIHLVTENVIISRNSQSSVKFIHSVKVLMAKNFIDNLSEEIRKGMNEKAIQGQYPSRAPVGYLNARHAGKSVMEIDPVAAPVIRSIFEWYTSDFPSLLQVKARLDSKIRTGEIDVDYKFTTSNLHRILANTIYYGDYLWHGVRYHGTHEPIIEKGLFLRAQEVSEANRRKVRRKHSARWAFQGLVTCAKCGGVMTPDRKKKHFVYYHCSRKPASCSDRPYVREERLDAIFSQTLGALRLPDDLLAQFLRSLEVNSEERDQAKALRLSDLRAQHSMLTKRLDCLYRDRLDHTISANAYKGYKAEIEKECDSVEAEILVGEEMNGEALRGGIRILQLLPTLVDRFENADPQEKRLCLSAVLSNSQWREGVLVVTYRQPLDSIASASLLHQKKIGKSLSKSADNPVWYSQRERVQTK